ncbi:hypothetical protein DBW_2516 [Desulfuromonas sp. DDH964]|uniref:spore coat protein U domain-containing protein n=1 Tax=Desulfuromonas sp. DDH964 TaxID=1823759 RepID=UPI00078EC85F|nr:spore coat protein U domain-containing protein [Desulfuromonas sp. DDH964]AMV72845.1 hypothetical protein DBW_2516 [Desulfuromonas sp. DDH964]
MKTMKLAALALALTGIFAAGNAMAASQNATVDVSATVLATCKVNSGGALDFGTLDPVNDTGTKSATATSPSITCTSGASFTVGDNSDTYLLTDGTNSFSYSMTFPASGSGTGTAQALAITGSVAATDYASAPAGAYTDTVTLTITY